MPISRHIALIAFALPPCFCISAPVDAERAVGAASAWIARSGATGRLPTGEVRTFSLNNTNAFHLVAMRGGGWVAMPADDGCEPVIAFNIDDALPDSDDGEPGWDVLAGYAGLGATVDDGGEAETFAGGRCRFAVTVQNVSPAKRASAGVAQSAVQDAGSATGLTWESLESDAQSVNAWRTAASLSRAAAGGAIVKIDSTPWDVCVEPLLKTRWSQSDVAGGYCYNYYTPNHWVCGCTATALAQTMYHFKWPAGPLPEGTFSVTVAGVEQSFAMERGSTGCFRWDSMTENPKSAGSLLTDENRQAIGMLTYNCGLALRMNYNSSGSGAATVRGATALKSHFGYSSADYIANITPSSYEFALLPNLDAGRPCTLEYPGHETVADGYAYSMGCLFLHMNMGWGGTSDAYYRQMIKGYGRSITRTVCNIATNGVPRYATGRVLDAKGNALADVEITAEILESGASDVQTLKTATDSHGIYAICVEAGAKTVSLTAAKDGFASLQESQSAQISAAAAGSSHGNDFMLYAEEAANEWTGGGDGASFSDADNWRKGVPAKGQTLVFGLGAPASLVNDIEGFEPGAIVFLAGCERIEIGGEPICGVSAMASRAQTPPVFNAKVEFANMINVTGDIAFPGGVWGAYPRNHAVFRGEYHLTTDEWWHPPADSRVPSGSILRVKNYCGMSERSLTIDAGGEIVVENASISSAGLSGVQGYLLTCNLGRFTATKGLSADSDAIDRLVSSSKDDGIFEFGALSGASVSTKYLVPDAKYIVGAGGISGGRWHGHDNWNLDIHPKSDYRITGTVMGFTNSTERNVLTLHTKDYYTAAPRTVSVSGNGALTGEKLAVVAAGNGVLSIENANCDFGSGLVVSNTCILKCTSGSKLGVGDVVLCTGTTLEFPADASFEPAVASGVLRTAAQPGEEDSKVHVCIGTNASDAVCAGIYNLLKAGSYGDAVLESLVLDNPLPGGTTGSFEFSGDGTLVLSVASAPPEFEIVEGTLVSVEINGNSKVAIPEEATAIGAGAFIDSAPILMNLTIPAGVTSIGDQAFYGCSDLTCVTMEGDAPDVGSNAFSGVADGCVVRIPKTASGYEIVDGKWQGMTAEYYGKPASAKLGGDGKWRIFDADGVALNGEEGSEELALGVKVLFSDDAEFQALVPRKEEIAAAGATVTLESDVTLTADADWRAFDFDLGGNTVTLMGWDLKVRKPRGPGRFTAGNLLVNGGFEDGGTGWSSIEESDVWSVTADAPELTGKNKPFAGNHWCLLDAASNNKRTANGIRQAFTTGKANYLYVKFRNSCLYDGETLYNQYVSCSIDDKTTANVAANVAVSNTTAYADSDVYKTSARIEAGSHEIYFSRYTGATFIDEITVSPESHLTFDIPEGETFNNTNITLGGASALEFDGIGLQIYKSGKGTLVMSKRNENLRANGFISFVVKEGVAKQAARLACGAQYSRIMVEPGAQFDINGKTEWDYDYDIEGSGPDGSGALTSGKTLAASDAYTQSKTGFLRKVRLTGDATVCAADGANMGMWFYNYKANTATMNGHTLTYDGQTRKGARIFLGNMSYSGAGKIVVATNGWVQTHESSPSAPGCDVEVFGAYWQNSGRLTPVKSLVFRDGSIFRELNKSQGVISVYGKYAPPAANESGSGLNAYPRVKLGAAGRLATTLDLSEWSGTFDDSAAVTLAFQSGSTVTVETGARMFGEDGALLYKWKYKSVTNGVTFVAGKSMAAAGATLEFCNEGIRAKRMPWTVTTPVAVPFETVRTFYPKYLEAAGGDYEAAANATGANGYAVWQCYVAGLDPDNPESKFSASIEMIDGKPVVAWKPDSPELRATRAYTLFGKKTLDAAEDWQALGDAADPATPVEGFRFFRIGAGLK